MEKKRLVFLGAGGHSKSVYDSLDKEKYELIGYVDPKKTGTFYGVPVFGTSIEDVPDYKNCVYFVTIGDNDVRQKNFEELRRNNLEIINIVDKTAIVAEDFQMGIGNFIGKQAIVNGGVKVGDNCIINTRALVEHDCLVGSNVHLSTNSVINGGVRVEDNVFIGSMSVCIGLQTISRGATVGAGAVVLGNVAAGKTVVGVPAREK